MTSLEACIDEVLRRGLNDWIQAAEIASIAKVTGGALTDDLVIEATINIVRYVLGKGLMVVGDVTPQGFQPWNMTAAVAASESVKILRGLKRIPDLGEAFWLSNTEEGDRRVSAG